MIIQSVILRPYINGQPSEDGWEISEVCEIINFPAKKITETLGLFYPPTKHGNICLKLYDECEEIHTAVIEHGEFHLQLKTRTETYTLEHCKNAKYTMSGGSGDDFPMLYMTVSLGNIKIEYNQQKQ